MPLVQAIIGFPEEANDFMRRHSSFCAKLPNLRSAISLAFERTLSQKGANDRVVFFLGRLCAEEFLEVYMLCGNGYGVAALKILRGLFEKAVTARYLHLHPDETETFLGYHFVAQNKLISAIERSYGTEVLPVAEVQESKRKFGEVRDVYMIPDCDKCGTRRLNHTWTRLDFVSMASEIKSLSNLIVPAYYIPMRHLHSTPASILDRVRATGDDLKFMSAPQRGDADRALIAAHQIVLDAIELQVDHFGWNVSAVG